jgi:hypothetical protein
MNTAKKILLLIVPFVAVSAAIASDRAEASKYEPARNAQGHPDLQGIWDFRTLTPLERPRDLGDKQKFTEEEEAAYRNKVVQGNDTDNKKDLDLPAEFDVEVPYNNFWLDYGTTMDDDRRTSLIVDPPNGRLPELTPAAMAGRQNYLSRELPVREFFSIGLATFRPEGPESLGLSERCMVGFNAGPPLIPSAYNNNLRIVQAPDHVVLFTEMVHDARVVPMDGSPHLPTDMHKWTGDSRGHWEGDTLVVETRNFTDKTPSFQLPISVDDPGQIGAVGTGKGLHLIEKFTRTSDSVLMYEYTVNDPATFTKAFTVAIPLRATEDQIFEYACHEGNHAMVGMLGGARQLEREAAAAAN